MIETERIKFRKIEKNDFNYLARILKDKDVMYAWESPFNDEEVSLWIDKNLVRYDIDGYSYLMAFEKTNNNFLGVVGLLNENIDGQTCLGIVYIFAKEFWGKGYAYEACIECLNYAFNKLNALNVIADIRPNNISSVKLAERLGMIEIGIHTKVYKGIVMPHKIFEIKA